MTWGLTQACCGEVEVVFDAAEDVIGDAAFVAHAHDRMPFGTQRLILQLMIEFALGRLPVARDMSLEMIDAMFVLRLDPRNRFPFFACVRAIRVW